MYTNNWHISHILHLILCTSLYYEYIFSSLRVVLVSDDIIDCDEALLFEATARWLEHCPSERENHQNICLSLLRLVRFPIMDSCLLSDVIKGHPLMVGAERTNLLLEAFEHHALRWLGLTSWKAAISSIYLSINLSVYLSIYLCIHKYLSTNISIYLSIYLTDQLDK